MTISAIGGHGRGQSFAEMVFGVTLVTFGITLAFCS
jgi:hypothetical protein